MNELQTTEVMAECKQALNALDRRLGKQLEFPFDDSRPKKPWFPCTVWDEWYELLSFGYSSDELNKRIHLEHETYRRWKREFNEFQRTTKEALQ